MALLMDGTRSAAGAPDDAVRRLYAACHLKPPVVVTARNAAEFSVVCAAATARTGPRRSLAIVHLFALCFMFAVTAALAATAFSGPEERIGHVLDGGTLLMSLPMLIFIALMPVQTEHRRTEATPGIAWRLAALLLCLGATVPPSLAFVPGPVTAALAVAAMASQAIVIVVLLGIVLWPCWRRREIAADLGAPVPLRGGEPVLGMVEHRLASALVSVDTAAPPPRRAGPEALAPTRRAEAAHLIQREGTRAAEFWHDVRPVLGRAVARFGPGWEVARLGVENRAEVELPEVLNAAVMIDRTADALCVLDGIAVVLPANAPLTFPTEHGAPGPGRHARGAVFDWLGYRGVLAVVLRLLPARAGDRLLARYLTRIPDAPRRTGAIKAFGTARFFEVLRSRPVQQDRFGRLHVLGRREDPSVFVEVEDPAILPDGSRRRYWLAVPPHVATAHEAVAATFGRTAGAYHPAVES
ncbi:hypothetical protein IGS68_00900 [Skermanella sp. TT6]|uniref:DUF6745 domain-containing protein n=1 Tax=Skermanella cutis TaxID=2775420 RepID=A0ABX7B6C3_9PROT|nr:hypothetical protein [Skermanella sp. TT6]QQP89872.1 hypothetical protein IGS68_00900 [Skermanella sp. TT6]